MASASPLNAGSTESEPVEVADAEDFRMAIMRDDLPRIQQLLTAGLTVVNCCRYAFIELYKLLNILLIYKLKVPVVLQIYFGNFQSVGPFRNNTQD